MKLALTFPGCHKRAGVEKIMLECANFLARRDHDVTVYANEFEPSALVPAVRQVHVPLPKLNIASALGCFDAEVSRLLRTDHADVLCTFGTICPTGGVLWVQSVHGAWLEISQSTRNAAGRLRQFCNPSHPLLLRRDRLHFAQRRYKRLIALTDVVANDLQRLYDVPAEDISIVPNGFSLADFNVSLARSMRSQSRGELGYAADDKVVIFVANELERKGFSPLIEAIARLGDERVKLLVVGNVSNLSCQGRLAQLGLTKRVKFVGPSDAVTKYYAAADVFALPTKYEAWGMVIIEALACGLPVVTSKLAGASIAVRNGENGFLLDNPMDCIELEDQLRKAVYCFRKDPHELSDSVKMYSWDYVLRDYEEILLQYQLVTTQTGPR